MGKTIIISKRQLTEIYGADSSYLDAADNDFNEYNGHTEVSVGANLTNKRYSEPLTTDKLANGMVKNPNWNVNGNTRPLPLTCGKKKSKLTEANKAGENRTWHIPDDIYDILKTNVTNYKGNKNDEGWDRINFLAKNRDVGYDEMRRLKNFFGNQAKKKPQYYELIGGTKMEKWVDKSLNSFVNNTSSIKQNNKELNTVGSQEFKNSGNGAAHTSKNTTTSTFDGKITTF